MFRDPRAPGQQFPNLTPSRLALKDVTNSVLVETPGAVKANGLTKPKSGVLKVKVKRWHKEREPTATPSSASSPSDGASPSALGTPSDADKPKPEIQKKDFKFHPDQGLLSSKVVKKVNMPFLCYLDFFERGHKEMEYHSKAYIFDAAWESWSTLLQHQRNPHHKTASKIWDENDASYDEAFSEEKPQLIESLAGPKQEDVVAPDINFEDQFEPVEPARAGSHEEAVPDAPTSFQLQNVMSSAGLETIEAMVEAGVKYLDDLKEPIQSKSESSSMAVKWVEQIETLQKSAERVKTVIGVVGSTGAGKSSLLNAILDEERLV